MKAAFWIFLTLSIITSGWYFFSPGTADNPDKNFALIPVSQILVLITGIIGVGFLPRKDLVFFSSSGLGLALFLSYRLIEGMPFFFSPVGSFFLIIAVYSGIQWLVKKVRQVAAG